MHITPNNKLASVGTIGLLFLAGIAGMVFLLPYNAAHAASPTVALSTISGGVETAATSGTVGSNIVITGNGFASNAPISITSTSGTSTVSWFITNTPVVPNNCGGTFAGAYGGIGTANSLFTSSGATACLTTTATGMFKVFTVVPALPGGANTIVVSDGSNSVSTSFTITPKVSISFSGNNFGYPEQAVSGTITVTGFGAGESVSVATTSFTTASYSCTTGSTLTGGSTASSWGANKLVSGTSAGTCTATPGVAAVADVTGGSKSVTATGATSGLTATTSYTVKPWAAFYNSAVGVTTYSFIGTAPTSLLIEVHGMTAQTVPANSITIGGVATSHASFTIGSSGGVGGAGADIVVSPTGNVPFGPANVVVAGTTFSYALGNIALGVGTWGGVMISSIAGTSTSTGVASVDAASYKPGAIASGVSTTSTVPAQNQVGFFGYGFVPGSGTGGVVSETTPTGLTWTSAPAFFAGNGGTAGGSGVSKPDSNGAFFGTAVLGDTAWSLTATPTTAASYSPVFSQASVSPANVLSPSFGITPWIDTSKSTVIASTVDFTTTGVTYTSHGFGITDTLTATVGGGSLTSYTGGSASPGTCTAGSLGAGACVTGTAKVPDIAGGPQNLVITGSVSGQTVTATGAVTYDPAIIGTSGCSTTCALNNVAGPSGSATILRTGTTFGVHGLLANTAYRIVWNGQTGLYYSFTSTATGGIPVPGVQITIPADTSGLHIIDVQVASSFGTSAIFAGTLQGDYFDNDAGLTTTQNTQFGDMLFQESTSLVAAPTVVNAGGSTVVTGNGLAANTLYDLGISMAGVGSSSPAAPTTCALTGTLPAAAPTTISGFFTSTSGGTVPAGVTVAITDMPTYAGLEQGTLYCVFAQTGPNFGTTSATGIAQFILQANANLNMTSAPSGHNVIITAHGLNANKGYNVLFAPYACGNSGAICGTVVGAVLSNGQGAGSSTFTVPSTIQTSAGSQPVASGSGYNVELQAVGSSAIAIASPPTLTVGSVSTSTCNTTTCMSAGGASTVTTIGGLKTVQTSFTNTSNAPVTAIVYAVVHNALGQTVSYSTATITANAGASATAYNTIFGLAPGTYSVSIFATSTSGTAISSSSTVSVTI